MQHRLPLSLVSFVLLGLWSTACGDDPAPSNQVPVLTGPFVQAADVTSGTAVSLSLEATDADGDSLTYAWVQTPATPAGTFSDPALPNPTWTAPQVTAATSFQLGVTVSDGKEGTVRRSVTMLVRPAPATNRAPVVTSGTPTATPASATGSVPVQLALSASDPDGDALTYSWSQEPATPVGSFSSPFSSSPSWISPTVTTTTTFTLKVTVSDDKGGSTQAQVNVTVAPPSATNRAPTISQAAAANPTSVTGPVPVQLSVGATDPDSDTLTYSWAQTPASPAGSFNNAAVANPSWTAPTVATPTTFTLAVNVSDGRGGTAQSQVSVSVAPPVPQNTSPTLTAGPSASPTTINEQEVVNLSVSATDADEDPLTYAWTQMSPASPVGTFSSSTSATPTWTAPDVTANGTYTLRVTVSDGRGGSAQGTVDITVQKVNQPPAVAPNITGPSTLLAGDTGSFSISATDPDGDPLTYSWDQTDPATPGTWVGSRTAASAQWFSPAVGAQTSFTLSVSVTDGQSTPEVRTVTFPVTVPNYSNDVRAVWSSTFANCVSCHGAGADPSLLPTTPVDLLDVPASVSCSPTATIRVQPGDPDNSVLIRKMEGTTCGSRMPRNNPGYFDTNPGLVVRVRSWILAGAPEN